MRQPHVQSGLDVLREERFAALRGRRLGVLAHAASVACDLRHLIDLLLEESLDLRVVFEPEHGLGGTAQDMQPVVVREEAGVRRVSLYGRDPDSLHPPPETLENIDLLLIDLQDVGSRYYTYAVTMRYCLEACARAGVQVLVADRPNPLSGVTLEGPLLQDGYASFVGAYRVPVRHGLTLGELARLAISDGIDADLEVVPMRGWERSMWFDDTGLPWVAPSPNMPTLDTAVVYPGSCLLEATNLSEGRGTTRPFELLGAPWLNGRRLAETLNACGLDGIRFRAVDFTPTFQKHAGASCQGVQLHVIDRERFKPFACGLHVLREARRQSEDGFHWRDEPYEFVSDIPAIDLLGGSPGIRRALDNGDSLDELQAGWQTGIDQFVETRRPVLLYDSQEGP